ncbi:MAG: hypothetical protein CH6_1265 [Candidatus Kapaibacterium sp.]|nr:MAG: hypothetical protein CH6_1265 [Candidatus Kapabacteria bacterium]
MNVKQALLILAIVLGSLIFVFLILVGLYKFAPGIFGVPQEAPKKEEKIEKVKEEFKSEPKVVLSKYEYDEWIQKSFNAQMLMNENQFLMNYSKNLQDSLKKLNQSYSDLQANNSKLLDSLNKLNNIISQKSAENAKLLAQIQQKDKAIAELQSLFEKQKESGKALTDSAKQIVYQTFAKIYENSKPEEVAKILELLNDEDALAILKSMNKKKAGKVIDLLKPERSAKIFEASFK